MVPSRSRIYNVGRGAPNAAADGVLLVANTEAQVDDSFRVGQHRVTDLLRRGERRDLSCLTDTTRSSSASKRARCWLTSTRWRSQKGHQSAERTKKMLSPLQAFVLVAELRSGGADESHGNGKADRRMAQHCCARSVSLSNTQGAPRGHELRHQNLSFTPPRKVRGAPGRAPAGVNATL
jgi:hypothetical protein